MLMTLPQISAFTWDFDVVQGSPLLVFLLSALIFGLSLWLGILIGRKTPSLHTNERRDMDLIVGSALTLLGLIIGFSFSLAAGRYDQRKNYEEEEANAIGTEYLRAGLLPAADAAELRALLREYLHDRIRFYATRSDHELALTNEDTARLQARMWAITERDAARQPNQVNALVASGMNDVINAQGYTQAAWWYHIPEGAWLLMALLAIGCSILIGFNSNTRRRPILLVMPVLFSAAFYLIADIDAPRHGLIHVLPQNLIALAQSLPPP
jgi:hypothetical protein